MTSDMRWAIQQLEEVAGNTRSSFLRLNKHLDFEWIERKEHANKFTKGEAAALLFALNHSCKDNTRINYYAEDEDLR